jgi:hypothetical protein
MGGLLFRAINRANVRLSIFGTDENYAAFEPVVIRAIAQ